MCYYTVVLEMKLLLIDDNKELVQTLRKELSKYFIVETARTGKQGEYLAQVNDYELIILDITLPDLNGIEVCKLLRESGIHTPIIMLTGHGELATKVSALDLGADDYVIKPFKFPELLSRMRAVLRRQKKILPSNILTVGDLQIDLNKRLVFRKDKIISLRKKEFYLLEYLVRNVGNVITREMILNHVWASENDFLTNIVDVHIKYLRDHIDRGFDKKLIKTIHGLGYKLEV